LQRGPASVIYSWGEGLEIDQRIVAELTRYSREEGDLGDTYAPAIAADVRRLVFQDAAAALTELPGVGDDVSHDVTFPSPGFAAEDGQAPEGEHQREFEGEFIRIEVLATFQVEGVSAEEALRIYTGRDCRMEGSSRIERIWSEDELSCIEVGGVKALLLPTLACNRIDEMIVAGLASQHSQVVSNPGGDDYQTVYFKESLKTFVEAPGGLALHYISYTRAAEFGSIKRSLGRGHVAALEQKKIEALRDRLSNRVK
jgi:hypothetical protein